MPPLGIGIIDTDGLFRPQLFFIHPHTHFPVARKQPGDAGRQADNLIEVQRGDIFQVGTQHVDERRSLDVEQISTMLLRQAPDVTRRTLLQLHETVAGQHGSLPRM